MPKSPAGRLKSVDAQFADIERLIRELRKRFADMAEEVRIAAEELAEAAPPAAPVAAPAKRGGVKRRSRAT